MDTDAVIDIQTLINGGDKALHIHLHPAFFNYSIVDLVTSEILICRSNLTDSKEHQISPTALDNWIKQNLLVFNLSFKSTKVCVNSFGFSLLNDEALATEKSFKLLNHYSELTHQLFVDKIDTNLFIQYALNKRIVKIIESHFSNNSIKFGDFGLLCAASNKTVIPKNCVICQILENEVTLIGVKDSSLAIYNKFMVKSPEDILYFILSVYQNCGLDPNVDVLHLTGLVEADSPMYELIFSYVRTINFTSGFTEIIIKDSTFSTSKHYYFNLFNIK